jgi:Tfp pilus assembly protein PilF
MILKRMFILCMLIAVLAGCSAQHSREDRVLSPRENAAAQLTRQGIEHLDAGRPDNALRLFEQAVGLDPSDGPCYYYMAQAWIAKGKYLQAKRFNHLARDHTADDMTWQALVLRQAEQIERLSR